MLRILNSILNFKIFLYFNIFFIITLKIAALEGAYAIKYNLKNAPKSFSAQQLLDCSYYKYSVNGVIGNLGCNGGFDYHTLYYAKMNGIMLASDYPYVGYVKS